MNKYTVEVSYEAIATYFDIEAETPEQAIQIASEKDYNNEKEVEILFDNKPSFTVMDNHDRIIKSVTPTKFNFEHTLKTIIEKAKEKYNNKPEDLYQYLITLGFPNDLLAYFKIYKETILK